MSVEASPESDGKIIMKMQQTADFPEVLDQLVKATKYREGWSFRLEDVDRGQGSSGLTLKILTKCTDSYHPETYIRVWHYMIVPAAGYDERSWRRWLFEQILLVERHEAAEFFQIGDTRPYAPHHGPGNDPYIIFELGTAEDVRTSYLGKLNE
jgi:hypothetical protein